MIVHRYALFVITCMAIGTAADFYLDNKDLTAYVDQTKEIIQGPFLQVQEFIELPAGSGPASGTVHVYTPDDAGGEARKRADDLIAYLADEKIPYTESESVKLTLPPTTDSFLVRRIEVAIRGEAPVVIVNGWIQANPAPTDVARQFRKTQ